MPGTPAAVMGDKIVGMCMGHQIPSPPAGNPGPAPPMPFAAPLLQGLATKVLIAGKPAAVVGSSGINTPPHVGLHLSDLFVTPTAQQGRVVGGSTTVLIEGKPAAKTGSQAVIDFGLPGNLIGSAATVLVGG
jgi:uncharacterized Zn-binding protein involved in type VI secretion